MKEPDRIGAGRHAELIMQGGGAELVLAAHELLLMLQGVTAHQEPVGWLTALVGVDRELAKLNCHSEISLVEMHPGQAFQGLEVQLLQASLLGEVPITIPVIFKKRATIKADGSHVCINSLMGMALASSLFGTLKRSNEFGAIDPPLQFGVRQVASVFIEDVRIFRPR